MASAETEARAQALDGRRDTSPALEMLSPSEVEQLRRKSKGTQDLATKEFRRRSLPAPAKI